MRRFERLSRRALETGDALIHRAYGARWNPLHLSGTLAAWMLVLLTATGLYLLLFYRVGAPAESVQRIAADPWLGSWMRSLHRYATDLFVIAAAVHAIRLFAQQRSWGPRTRAWISGVVLFAVGLISAWTGFVMVWDSFGQRLALAGARLLDAAPIFSEPLARIFAGDRPIPSAFFFVNLFLHIALPLAMGAVLWFHVSRVARPVYMPPRAMRWATFGVLTALSVLVPAPLGAPAHPLVLPDSVPFNLTTSWWVPIAERAPPWTVWLAVIAGASAVLAVPRMARRPRENAWAPSVVDPRLCTGCNQCPQDCPWEAITMVQRRDDRPTLLAQVDPALCVSCGICAGSCAPMGIGPPGRSGRDQLADVRAELLPALKADPSPARIVAICCERTPAGIRDALDRDGALLHQVTCAGNLHSSVVELLVRAGAGVFIGACPPRDCTAREGPKWLHERLYNDREAELQERVDRRRIRVTTLAAGLASEAVESLRAFRADLLALDRPAGEGDADVERECDIEVPGVPA